jgi:hypothetical protein
MTKVPKVSIEQVGLTMQQLAKEPEKCKELLKYWFSDKKNIDTFSQFVFPEHIQGNVQDFHNQFYEIFTREGNDAVAAPRGHAKQIADSTPVLTPNGWVSHGDLDVGDYVYHPSGKPVKVIAKNSKTPSDYVVETRDGEKIRCHKYHEWTVFDRNKKKFTTLETKDMLNCESVRSRFQLPLREPLQGTEQALPLDPYFLGVWLGDGSSSKCAITHDKRDFNMIDSIPYKVSTVCVHKDTGVLTTYFSHQNIVQTLRAFGLYNNKHIPDTYKLSSLSQRLELMAGLIDSDGYVDIGRGRVRFVNVNYKLIKDVEELALSLGSRPYIVSQQPSGLGNKTVYTLCFDPVIDIPTRLKRKKITRIPKRQRLGITRVSYEPNGEVGNCIQVDSEDGLYLVGKRLIPTHNSTTIGVVFISWLVVNNLEKYIVYISQNHTKTVQFVDPLRYEFKNNRRLKWLYGNLSPKNTRDDDGRDREDCVDIAGIRIEAVSFEKNLRGFKYGNMRPTLIIGDDIDSDERVTNPVLRDKDRNKLFKVILPSLDINGRFKMVGTIIHHDCLLKNRLNEYNGKIFRAYDENGVPLWSERFTKEKLEGFRKEYGSAAFESEFMNNPIDNASSLIKREWVEGCFVDKSVDELDFDELYLGVDFAFSDRVSADNSAFVDIGVNYHQNGSVKNLVLLNGELGKGLSLKQHWEKIKNKFDANGHDMVLLEENSIKGSVEDVRDLKIPYRMFWMGSRDAQKDKQLKSKSKTISKINSINRLAVSFEYKKWIIPYKTIQEKELANRLVSELTSWGLVDGKLEEFGIHPDLPIPLILINEFIRMSGGVA